MKLNVPHEILQRIHRHAERAYPDEGAGLLLGEYEGQERTVREIMPLENAREAEARRNRYQLTPQDYMRAEDYAESLGFAVLGVFHSHPDHPNRPSEFDRQWAWPNFSYLITSVKQGDAEGSRSWRLSDDREAFTEEAISVNQDKSKLHNTGQRLDSKTSTE